MSHYAESKAKAEDIVDAVAITAVQSQARKVYTINARINRRAISLINERLAKCESGSMSCSASPSKDKCRIKETIFKSTGASVDVLDRNPSKYYLMLNEYL